MKSHKTNYAKKQSSHLAEKVHLREIAIRTLNKKTIRILDCFHGDGLVWKTVKENNPDINITVIGIEKDITRKSDNLCLYGNNLKVIPSLNLAEYDVIDLDAYGCCFKQIQAIFKNGTANKDTPIIYTEIGIIHGRISDSIFEMLGLLDLIKKCEAIFHIKRNIRTFFHGALSCYGIKQVKEYYFLSGSNVQLYGFFTIH